MNEIRTSRISSRPKQVKISVKNKSGRAQTIVWAVVAIATFLLAWQLLTTLTPLKEMVPTPAVVFPQLLLSFVEPIGKMTLWGHIGASLMRVLAGYALAAVVGIVLGIAMGISKTFRAIVGPLFEVIRPIPGVAWIPLAILWFGIGETPKIFIIFISAMVVITQNVFDGASNVDDTLVGAAKMLGADDRQVFFKIVLPFCVPQIFTGLQTALSVSWMVVLAAEMVRSEYGVGWIITTGSDSGNMVQVIIGMIVIGIIGLILASALRGVEKKLCVWKEQGN
jgi:NitT/TauT family transport system permease protein/sulfonate transport system permease protein